MRYRLDGDRELLLERLRDELGIEKERYKADVLDAALIHLYQSIQNVENVRGEVDPTVLKELNTDVLSLQYRTSVVTSTGDIDDVRFR